MKGFHVYHIMNNKVTSIFIMIHNHMYMLPSNGTSQRPLSLIMYLCVFVFTLKGSYIVVHEQKPLISKTDDHVISKSKGCGYRNAHSISI